MKIKIVGWINATKDEEEKLLKMKYIKNILIILILLCMSTIANADTYKFFCGENMIQEDIDKLIHIREYTDKFKYYKDDIVGLEIDIVLWFKDNANNQYHRTMRCKDVEAYAKFARKLRNYYEQLEKNHK